MKNLPKLLTSVIGCELVGIAATPFTISSIPTWYQYLNKPFFSPPNWVFGPVWTALYFLMGISVYLIWTKNIKNQRLKQEGLKYFLIQLGLNFLWSLLFFGLHSPLLGLIDIVILWVMIVITMRKFYPLSKIAFYLLVPYLIWVSFASFLNLSIVLLNP